MRSFFFPLPEKKTPDRRLALQPRFVSSRNSPRSVAWRHKEWLSSRLSVDRLGIFWLIISSTIRAPGILHPYSGYWLRQVLTVARALGQPLTTPAVQDISRSLWEVYHWRLMRKLLPTVPGGANPDLLRNEWTIICKYRKIRKEEGSTKFSGVLFQIKHLLR